MRACALRVTPRLPEPAAEGEPYPRFAQKKRTAEAALSQVHQKPYAAKFCRNLHQEAGMNAFSLI